MGGFEVPASAPVASAGAGATAAGGTPAPLLVPILESTSCSLLEPAAFFVSWHGVLTLAYKGFTPALLDLKERLVAAHPGLPTENPGSRWPKTSLGALRDGVTLTQGQLQALLRICQEESAASFCAGQPAGPAAASNGGGSTGADGSGLALCVDSLAIMLYECRCCERLLSCQHVFLQPQLDASPPTAEEQQRVQLIRAEALQPGYWHDVCRPGSRESHYRSPHLGVTLAHPLWLSSAACAASSSGHVNGLKGNNHVQQHVHESPRPALQLRGLQEVADRHALLQAVQRLRQRVDAELPGLYAWFDDASLHVTLRAVIN